MVINKNKMPKLNSENITDRELSTIAFNQRVLALAQDPTIPLLERIKFIAIVGNNTDEFFMVRVGSYVQKHQVGIGTRSVNGYSPGELLTEIRQRSLVLMNEQRETMNGLLHEMRQYGIHIRTVRELDPAVREVVRTYFQNEVFPVLTPLAADHARPFPFISNLSLNIGVYLRRDRQNEGEHVDFVRIKVPDALPRLVNVSKLIQKYLGEDVEGDQLLWLEDVIANNLDLLFPGMEIVETSPFRVTRNADIDYEHEQESELLDISAVIEAGVREREFGSVTRLTVPKTISPRMLKRLISELDIDPNRDVYSVDGILGSSSLFELMKLGYPQLKYHSYVPRHPEFWPQGGGDIFAAIRKHDIFIHLPYDSFMPVEEFYRTAARDPDVLAIKATLYRVGENAPVVQALMEARENDKQVAVLVELKARFDEANNLEWARALEQKGVHVTYGVEKLPVKTHAKVTLVVRKERDGLRCYVHLGTGNYNATTARLYGDLGLFTANVRIAEDATRLFNRLTGYAPDTQYTHLLVAPEFLRTAFLQLIDNEIEMAQQGKPARLVFKMNQLEERTVIRKLYQASQAGVQIDLIVRGLCRLRPGIPGLSENIRVLSILGRFLEHSRIYYFHNAPPHQRIYAGSADLMRRNLRNRVETVFPVLDPRLQRKIIRILATELQGNVGMWELQSSGDYLPIQREEGVKATHSQRVFMRNSAGLDIELP
jgi:polyphosphate kinase